MMLTMLEASEVIRLGGLPYIFPLHIRFFYENSKLLKEYPFQQVTIKRCLNIDYYVTLQLLLAYNMANMQVHMAYVSMKF